MEAVPVTPTTLEAPKKKSKTGALIATIATAVLCGCPGLFAICWGALSAIVSFFPNADINIGGSSDPNTAFFAGVGALCGGIIFVAIPIVIGLLTLREKKPKAEEVVPAEPLPPAA
ncbi:MAG: hypothetical protein ABWK53_08490 [Anaerolineales bacterium]